MRMAATLATKIYLERQIGEDLGKLRTAVELLAQKGFRVVRILSECPHEWKEPMKQVLLSVGTLYVWPGVAAEEAVHWLKLEPWESQFIWLELEPQRHDGVRE